MFCKELIDYLSRFNPDERVSIIVVDITKRLAYTISAYQLMDEQPVLLLETTESEPLDEVLEEVDVYECLFCKDTYTEQDLEEVKAMGEKYHIEEQTFICADCYDDFKRLPLEEQVQALLQGSEYDWEYEREVQP